MAWTVVAAAQDIAMPDGAELTQEDQTAPGAYAIPIGPFADKTIPSEIIEGSILRQSWRIQGGHKTTLQILAPLRDQIVAAGFTVRLDCAAGHCGGFNFRFGTEVLPGPGMYVDLNDFHFLSARQGKSRAISVLVSRTTTAGYVQLIRVSAPGAANTPIPTAPSQADKARQFSTDSVAQTLETHGRVVLDDLSFDTGASSLGEGDFASLGKVAAYLSEHPERRIAIVGHTDSVGALARNSALSQKRAASVMERLIDRHGVRRSQLEAGGMGYLAPLVSNLSAEGREANRRVEAVLTSTK